MTGDEKNDHIKIADDAIAKHPSRGLNLRKTFSRDRGRSTSRDRSDIESTYDENFDTPRGVDFRQKQVRLKPPNPHRTTD
jgi:hypothetical protein